MDAVNVCPICGKRKGRNKNACSQACYSELRSHSKTCAVCGKPFPCPPTQNVSTCSPECRKAYRAKAVGENRQAYLQGLDLAHEAYRDSPICQPDENHANAKAWVIQSPGGETYECRNLMHFIRENAELFDGTAKQAWDGIVKIKYSEQGKRKHPVSQWKGWKLLSYGD